MDSIVPERIETDRLILRVFQDEDWRDLHEYYSDEIATRFTLQLHKKVSKILVKSLRKPMNNGYNGFEKPKITLFRRPPQVKSSKEQIHAKFHKIPTIRFEDQQIASFSALVC